MTKIGFLLGVFWGSSVGQLPLFAQACKDEAAMVEDYKKSIADLADMVKKESLTDFQNKYHQRSCLTKLTLSLGFVDELVSCLDKAAHDTTANKEQVDAYKAKRETYAKLKGKLDQDRNSLKAAEPREAKALIEKFDLSN
jgi:exonuclease VII large subunit